MTKNDEVLQQTKYALAKNVAVGRKAHNMSQQALADASGVSKSTIAAIETGKGEPSLSTIVAIACTLQCSPQMLFFDDSTLNFLMLLLYHHPEELKKVKLSKGDIAKAAGGLGSGLRSGLYKAAKVGAQAAEEANFEGAAKTGAAIGTCRTPGIGTAIGAAFANSVGPDKIPRNAKHAYKREIKKLDEGKEVYGVKP
ncbi:transcriptional regulator, XRE family [Desulfatibacillum aliphaticivorans]|uniref:Transcriptional regulator, XRE family n=1 Tax=Desulfatibacillum aliphaticivorans TaxID=218208 RepID=B8F9V4_DESAL|nr:helix-turn-helix transcriptional regulator [Desulfatibacillum aliphaticivorans]ACL03050.1 transcriptional regulator, XRE family [Desulfatibacillum aliphaticivorans]